MSVIDQKKTMVFAERTGTMSCFNLNLVGQHLCGFCSNYSTFPVGHFNYWWSTSLRRIFSLYATILHALKYEQWCSKVKRKQLISWKTLNMTCVFWSVYTFKKHMTCVNSHHIWVLPHIYMDCFLVSMLMTILWYLWQLTSFFSTKGHHV